MGPEELLPSVGDILVGKYRLTRKLGRGSMGVVYEALHLRLGQKVAIKVIPLGAANRPEHVYRFEREAHATARLQGPHTARVFDADTSESLSFLVMELLEGHSLRDELDRRGRLPIDEAVHYVREACEGIDEAHRAGIIHRDIKPSNLFLCCKGSQRIVKVLDFGVAKVSNLPSPDYGTASNTALGTYKYMSPEQAKSSRSVDARTDVWSLGVVLYQLLAGKTPFHGEGIIGIAYAIATQAPPPLRTARPDVPEALALVVERSLQKDVDDRYQTVRALSDALAPFIRTSTWSSTRPPALRPPEGSVRRTATDGEALPLRSTRPDAPHPSPESTVTEAAEGLFVVASEGAENDNAAHAAESQVTPIGRWERPPGVQPVPAWLVSATVSLVVASGISLGSQAVHLRSDNASIVPSVTPENVPGTSIAVPSKVPTPPLAEQAKPPAHVSDGDILRSPEPTQAERGKRNAELSIKALDGLKARPPAKSRPAKAQRDKPASTPTSHNTGPASSTLIIGEPPGPEIFD